ncbi:MAG: YigZ family protein [Candidatus Eisenbacteria bacterium]|uniref:YigZ family protein n=1 Tax=Eiseniibacteriota bacterium TaxID=2212470 RepID=A0A956LYJ7_UNCEI|nr:YigZ family protein [Candidatus Eisenbacteria bacterium]
MVTKPDPDRYGSIDHGPEIETKVQGSRFLGQAFRVATMAEAEALVHDVSRKYHDATHHCRAVRLGPPEGPFERGDDDGEPSGTAGTPILGALRRADIFDALIVVTRYFGGTKLGTGGLVRAYGDAARSALEVAPPRTIWREAVLTLVFAYEDVGVVETFLAREAGVIRHVERVFEARPRFVVTVLQSAGERLRGVIVEASAGRVSVAGPEPI